MSQVLVVEDEFYIQKLIKIILERDGHDVTTAGNGQEALDLLDGGLTPQLILLDIMMPGIDGLQVLQRLRNNMMTRDIPVVMLTALAQETVAAPGVDLGATDYIRKPFQPQMLLSRLAPFLSDHAVERPS